MSDIFDHELDAYESLNRMYFEGEWDGGYGSQPPDPLFYHIKTQLAKPPEVVGKAYKLTYLDRVVQVPQSICKNRNDKEPSIWVHKKIFLEICKRKS